MKVYMVLTYLQYHYKRSLNTDATVIVYNIHTTYSMCIWSCSLHVQSYMCGEFVDLMRTLARASGPQTRALLGTRSMLLPSFQFSSVEFSHPAPRHHDPPVRAPPHRCCSALLLQPGWGVTSNTIIRTFCQHIIHYHEKIFLVVRFNFPGHVAILSVLSHT